MSFLLFLLLQEVLLLPPSEGILYYVKPSPTTKCPHQHCETLQYYLENVDTAINQQKNVTMVFMNGTHTTNIIRVVIQVPVIKMRGESHKVILNGSSEYGATWLNFPNFTEVCIADLVMVQWALIVQSVNSSRFEMLSVKLYQSQLTISSTHTNFMFSACEFHNGLVSIDTAGSNITMADCKMISNSIGIQNSTVILSGVSAFTANQKSAISSYYSNITLSGTVLFINNTGIRGGAMALYSSTLNIAPSTNISFISNSALETGGAIYVDPSLIPHQLLLIMEYDSFPEPASEDIRPRCFYQLLHCNDSAKYTISFSNNSAVNGGDDIYGASLHFYQGSESGRCNLTTSIENSGISSVSSDPTRVCICDGSGIPQCQNNSYILMNREVHPGETFTVSAIVVGGDFGATKGTVYADFVSFDHSSIPTLKSTSQHIQVINNITHCTALNYSIHEHTHGKTMMFLTTIYIGILKKFGECVPKDDSCFRTTPVFLDITLLPCPPGFTLLGDSQVCDCCPALADNAVECDIINGKGLFSWTGNSLWVNITGDKVVYGQYCPFDYCDSENQQIDLQYNSNAQCGLNRAGRLCGGCEENYSLAIGSSHCIHCPNNNNLALIIFFAAAGFLLVFFISALNLTVTQGAINGLIFYANIVWIYQSIFFAQTCLLYTSPSPRDATLSRMPSSA